MNKKLIGECWIWPRGKSGGYATWRFENRGGKHRPVHREIYELVIRQIPEGLQIDHLCRNRDCVNPFHLEAVTQQENILRGEGLAARQARRDKCLKGHPFDHSYVTRQGKRRRVCRICNIERCRKFWEAKRAA